MRHRGAQGLKIVGDAVEILDHRLHGQRHVRSGVAVRDGVDVQVVDHLPVGGKPVVESDDDATQGGSVKNRRRHDVDNTGDPRRGPGRL